MKQLFLTGMLVTVAAVSTGCGMWGAASRGTTQAPFIASEDQREALPTPESLEVQYIANEGVLVTSRDKRVLIDGLHRKYADSYAYLPDTERDKIESAKPPFDKIDLVLVSHIHGDHFHPESVGLHLVNNPKATLLTSHQVADEVAAKFAGYESIRTRVKPITYALKQRQVVNVAGIEVEILGLGHGSGRHASIQNIGHVITLNGKKLLHVGDAEISNDIFDSFDLESKGIDIAFLPAWFLTSKEGRELIQRHIRPRHIIAVHVGPGEGAEIKRQVRQRFPNADVFGTMLEKKHF